jgi:hypothetical protein
VPVFGGADGVARSGEHGSVHPYLKYTPIPLETSFDTRLNGFCKRKGTIQNSYLDSVASFFAELRDRALPLYTVPRITKT